MKYITDIVKHTLEVKQSKFIAWLTPYEIYQERLEHLKNEHPKARHFVTAFRYINEYEQVVEHSNDDGEPKGTSGRPSLIVLQGQELINTAVIVVRYFGGTKLGTGGLVRAYSDAVNLVINEAEFKEYKKEVFATIEIEYSDVRFVEYECVAFGVSVLEKNFENKIVYKIKADEKSMEAFFQKVKRVVKTL